MCNQSWCGIKQLQNSYIHFFQDFDEYKVKKQLLDEIEYFCNIN